MNELKTYRELFQALLDGHDIEHWNGNLGEWTPSIVGLHFDSRNLDKDIVYNGKFRIKPTKPSINWDHVSKELNYLAVDRDGGAFLFKNRPSIDGDGWLDSNIVFVYAKWYSSFKAGNCDWKESLVKRPLVFQEIL